MDVNNSVFGKLNIEPHWYAIKTRNRHEKQVFDRLQKKEVETFLPLQTTYRYWSDRKKKVTVPLFYCYVFVKMALKDRMSILQTDGVVHIVSFNKIPAPIPDIQIDSLKKISSDEILISKADYFTVGQLVEVIHGPLKGARGILKKIKEKSRLILTVDVLKQAVSVDIDVHSVLPIR